MKKKVVTKAEDVEKAYYDGPEYYAVVLKAGYFSPDIRNNITPFLKFIMYPKEFIRLN